MIDRVIGLETTIGANASGLEALQRQIKVNGTGLAIGDAVALALRKVDEQGRVAIDVKATLEQRQNLVEIALKTQADLVQKALTGHSTEIQQELKDVWRTLAARDITRAAEEFKGLAKDA